MNPEIEKYGFWTMQIYYIGAGLFRIIGIGGQRTGIVYGYSCGYQCIWLCLF